MNSSTQHVIGLYMYTTGTQHGIFTTSTSSVVELQSSCALSVSIWDQSARNVIKENQSPKYTFWLLLNNTF